MLNDMKDTDLFVDYYATWITVYKEGAIRKVTLDKYKMTHQMLNINKTWDYKGDGGFLPTKNSSSVRKVQLDWQTVIQFAELVKDLPEDEPIFVKTKVYNSTVNDVLARHCKELNIPVISIHGLRHTHVSLSKGYFWDSLSDCLR